MGCLYGMYSEQINKSIRPDSIVILIVAAIIWATLFFLTEGTKAIIFCSASGILMCVSLAQLLVKYDIKILDPLIGSNYIIFLLSWYMNTFTQQFLHHFTEFPWWVYSILSFTCGVAVPCMIYKYMQAHADNRFVKVATVCLGQNLKKRI
jgi:predicted neutral ceramidase superfamily lipid hydrolase